MVFIRWKVASVCQSCCTSWEPVHVLIIQLSWRNMTKPCATGFPKCVTWTSTIFRVLSWLCLLRWVILGFHPHHYYHFPCFLASAFDASDFLTTIFSEIFEDVSLQKRLRSGWVWRMNRKVLSMELRKTRHNLSTSKPPKIWFLEWMTNVRNFLTLIKANSGLNGWTSFLART